MVLPAVKPNSLREPAANEILDPSDADPFMSSTARLTADVGERSDSDPSASCAPFKVLSDGESIFVFRQSVSAQHAHNLHLLKAGGLSGEATPPSGAYLLDTQQQKVPIVDRTLLCDRYTLAGRELLLRREVRYRRSRRRHVPAGPTDTLGAADMLGHPVVEPTRELAFVNELEGGSFEVLQLPTENPQARRWQILAYNADTKRIHSFNMGCDDDGLFRTQGDVRYTSPDAKYKDAVDEPGPGLCPHTGKALIPVYPSSTLAGCALGFNGTSTYATMPKFADDAFVNGITIEAWVFYDAHNNWSRIVDIGEGPSKHNIVLANEAASNTLSLHVFNSTAISRIAVVGKLPLKRWVHVAATVDSLNDAALYLDGIKVAYQSGVKAPEALPRSLGYIGKSNWNDQLLHGQIDELRIWSRALPADELARMHTVRRTGLEPDLIAYYRMDEGRGTRLLDLTGNQPDAQVVNPQWVVSTAPIVNNPGLSRSSYRLEGLLPNRGLSARLYHLQERSGDAGDGAPLKQQARVMLVATCREEGGAASAPLVTATLDLGVSLEGTLAESPTAATLPTLSAPDPRAFDDRIALNEELQEARAALSSGVRRARHLFRINDVDGDYLHVAAVACQGDELLVSAVRLDDRGRSSLSHQGPRYELLAYRRQADGSWAYTQRLPMPQNTNKERVCYLGRGLAIDGEFAVATSKGDALHIYRRVSGQWQLIHSSALPPLSGNRWENEEATPYALRMATMGTSKLRVVRTTRGGLGAATFMEFDLGQMTWLSWTVSGEQRYWHWSDDRAPDAIGLGPQAALVLIGNPDQELVRIYSWPSGSYPAHTANVSPPHEHSRWRERFGSAVSDMTQSGDFFVGDPTYGNADGTRGRVVQYRYTGSTPQQVKVLTGQHVEPTERYALPSYRGFGQQLVLHGRRLIVGDCLSERWEEPRSLTWNRSELRRRPGYSVYEYEERATQGWTQLRAHHVADYPAWPDGAQLALTDDTIVIGTENVYKLGFSLIAPDPALAKRVTELTALLAQQSNQLPSVPRYSGKLAHLDTDANGLTVYGARLDWAKAGSDAQLLDSIIGTVGLYYQSERGGLMGAHFDTLSARARFGLATSKQASFVLRARAADERLNALQIRVAAGQSAERCVLTLTLPLSGGGSYVETWSQVPRDLLKLAAVLNGAEGALATHGGTVSCNDPRYTLQNGSVLVRAHVDALAQGQVSDGAATRVKAGERPRWRASSPGKAFHFNGVDTQLTLPTAQVRAVPDLKQFTFEAWVKPDDATPDSALLHRFVGDTRAEARGFSVGLSSATPREGVYILPRQIIDCGAGIDFTKDFTLEAWTRGDLVIQLYKEDYVRNYGAMCWTLSGDVKPALQATNATPSTDQIANASAVPGAWRHWTLVRERAEPNGRYYKIYLDGVLVAEKSLGNAPPADAALRLYAGQAFAKDAANPNLIPGVYDVRVWDHARSKQELQASFERDLTGAEDGLVGYYRFDEGRGIDHSRYQRHASQLGDSAALTRLPGPQTIQVVGLVAGVRHPEAGVRWALSSAPIPVGIWTHVACTYREAAALAFADGQHVDLGSDNTLDLPGEVSVEVVVQPKEQGREQMLVCKGLQRAGGGQTVPYALLLDAQGYPTFMFEALHANGTTQEFRFKATKKINVGQAAHICVVREAGTSVEQHKGSKPVTYKDHTGKVTTVTVDTIESINPIEWFDIRIYVDGVEAGRFQHRDAQPAQCDSPLTLASMGGRDAFFNGLIGEVRVWSKAISMQDPYRVPRPREDGLAGWWRIDEGRGALLEDSAGQSTGRVRGGAWVANPHPLTRTFSLFLNGNPVEMPALPTTHARFSQSWGDPQLSLGCRVESGTPKGVFKGTVEELRVWRQPRTQEQVLDQLFSRARVGDPELVFAYSFDDDSTSQTSTELKDQGPMGLHLALGASTRRPVAILSTVPINEDAAQVRSTLNGIRSPFFSFADGRPSAAEYSDLQGGRAGELQGVMKRCYSYTDQGDWCLVTGFKVGDLSTEYLGQVQFAPQIVGYVEGPPPLPSENMTAGQITESSTGWQWIADYATVSLTEASSVTYKVSGSSERKITASLDLSISHELGLSEQELVIAPFGIGCSIELAAIKLADLTLKGHVDGARTWTNEASYSNAINRSKKLDVSLGAGWEDPQTLLNPTVGRRLNMSNMGYALVRSATADLYALRLLETQALVSFRMLPDLAVPVDWNIIPFQINPRYTKQGTLDGVVGYNANGQPVCDPDYPSATGKTGLSYHKPHEAYAYKRRIEREEMEIAAYLSGQSAPSPLNSGIMGGALGTLASVAMSGSGSGGGGLESAIGELRSRYGSRPLTGRYAKRNLVNTYVWTADGGFFAETEEKTDARSETVSGSFEVNASIALSLGFELSILSVGFDLELGASMGAGYTLSRSRSTESEERFGLEVGVNPPGDLMRYIMGANGYEPSNGGANVPGKVDAYRFMTFYLDADTVNFDHLFNQVIDPAWLADQKNPNARAMREARHARKKPPCWRVFHRVTWVSRVLPEVTTAPAATAPLSQRLSYAGIASNWELINLLGPYLKQAGQDRDRIRAALQGALVSYPELLPALDELVEFFALYSETVEPPTPQIQIIGYQPLTVFGGTGIPINRPISGI